MFQLWKIMDNSSSLNEIPKEKNMFQTNQPELVDFGHGLVPCGNSPRSADASSPASAALVRRGGAPGWGDWSKIKDMDKLDMVNIGWRMVN